jgi:uncharacterized protein with NRDE domain
LSDRTQASEEQLPTTGIPQWLEQKLSASFIHVDSYGTRCSTLMLQAHNDNMDFLERQFSDDGSPIATRQFQL